MLNVEMNGRPATVEELHRVAMGNFGHFTSFQVRHRAVRGLELHLERLEEASWELFDEVPPGCGDRVRKFVGQALGEASDASVRVTVVPGEDGAAEPDVLVSVTDPVPDTPQPGLRVQTRLYERELPHLKHLATFGLSEQTRRAVATGYDDALFTGRDGLFREGSEWNVAFCNGSRIVWPEAPVLPGITMLLLRDALTRTGVPWTTKELTAGDLTSFSSAAATNSACAGQPLRSVDSWVFMDENRLAKTLMMAWAGVEWDSLD